MISLLHRALFCMVAVAAIVYADTPRIVPTIVDSIPHEQNHFTQGLFFDGIRIAVHPDVPEIAVAEVV